MKAIETRFKGYRMRSRLEARWSVFLETLGVRWVYEPEGYELDGLRYLPDFWLPDQDCFVEIKPTLPTPLEADKAHRLAEASGKDVFVFFGEIPMPPASQRGYLFVDESAFRYGAGGEWDNFHQWCECPGCGCVGIQFEARADRLPCRDKGCQGDGARWDRGHNPATPRLLAAYSAARSARFGR